MVSFGSSKKLNEGWRFLRIDSTWNINETLRNGERRQGQEPDMKDSDYDDSRWRRVTLPHDWSPTKVLVRVICLEVSDGTEPLFRKT